MRKETKNSYIERMLNVLQYIQKNIDNDLPLEKLSEVAAFSPYHFHRIFKGLIGESLGEYVRRIRIERAGSQLRYSQKKITEIAFQAGYDSYESFCRVFKEKFGVPPSLYRKKVYIKNCDLSDFPYPPSIKNINGDYKMNAEIKNIKSLKSIYARHTGAYSECHTAWEKVCTFAGKKNLINKDTQYLGICYDDPDITESSKIRYDACLTVENDIKGEGEIGFQNIEGGEYAVYLHKGPFSSLSESYSELCGRWIPSKGREMKHAPSIEVYLNDPDNTKPEDLEIEIRVPLV